MRNLTLTLVVAIAIMGGFYTGFRYEKSKADAAVPSSPAAAGTGRTGAGTAASPSTGAGAGAGAGGAGAGGGGFGGRGTIGTVSSLNGSTLTLKDAQGNSVTVNLQPTTTVTKTVAGSTGDLTQGVTVTVAGQRTADGTVTATSVTIVPAGTALGGGRGAPAASPSPGG
jgi:ABC-type Fe3+-hydroxamate transport system substrate-binding protein